MCVCVGKVIVRGAAPLSLSIPNFSRSPSSWPAPTAVELIFGVFLASRLPSVGHVNFRLILCENAN